LRPRCSHRVIGRARDDRIWDRSIKKPFFDRGIIIPKLARWRLVFGGFTENGIPIVGHNTIQRVSNHRRHELQRRASNRERNRPEALGNAKSSRGLGPKSCDRARDERSDTLEDQESILHSKGLTRVHLRPVARTRIVNQYEGG